MNETRQWKIAECFTVNYYPDLGEKHPRFVNSWNGEPSSFRVTSFYRIYERPEPKPAKTRKEQMIRDIMNEIRQKDEDEKSDRQKLLDKFEVILERCRFEDAEFIHGQSVSYPTVPIEWCNFIGDVNWEQEYIDKNREEYEQTIQRLEKMERGQIDTCHKETHPRFDDAAMQLRCAGLEGGEKPDTIEYYYEDAWTQKYAGLKRFEVGREDDEDEEE